MTASSKRSFALSNIGLPLPLMIGAVAALIAIMRAPVTEKPPAQVCDLYIDSAVIKSVPVADTDRRRSRGLSGRENVGSGMWFEFDTDSRPAFWMKDTRMALSVAFIASDGHITEIQDMAPGSLAKVRPQQPVRYAMEVSRGDFQALGIGVGSTVNFRRCTVSAESDQE